MVIYDVWAYHKAAVKEGVINRVDLELGIIMIFLCSLTPALNQILSVLKLEYITDKSSAREACSFIYWDTRLVPYILMLGVYGCVAKIATKDISFLRRRSSESDTSRIFALKQLKESSTTMVLIIVPIGYLSLMGHITSPGPIALIAL